jgi:7-cyano-7-deazaguanine synthase
MKKQVVISLSGGMDSSTLLLHYLSSGYECTCISFDYGQKHKIELERATELVKYINSDPSQGWLCKEYPKVKHRIIKLDGLSQLLNSSLVEGGEDVPEGHYAEENMKSTVVPNRNKIFSSIAQAIALSIATQNKSECKIALGIHAGDHSIYPDCRQEFRDADYKAFLLGNWDSHLVTYDAPFLHVNKFDILKHGLECCKEIGLDFDEVYKRTNTSYKPIAIDTFHERYEIPNRPYNEVRFNITTRKWYSDYKSAASVERIEAFIKLGRPDSVEYADETGPVTWEVARSYVEKVLKDHLESQK